MRLEVLEVGDEDLDILLAGLLDYGREQVWIVRGNEELVGLVQGDPLAEVLGIVRKGIGLRFLEDKYGIIVRGDGHRVEDNPPKCIRRQCIWETENQVVCLLLKLKEPFLGF